MAFSLLADSFARLKFDVIINAADDILAPKLKLFKIWSFKKLAPSDAASVFVVKFAVDAFDGGVYKNIWLKIS